MKKISQETLKSLVDYNPETGIFIWKYRDRSWFDSNRDWNRWNTMYSGQEAFKVRHPAGFKQGTILGHGQKAHRMAWLYVYGNYPEKIDHINGNNIDNRIINLRDVTDSVNSRNRKTPKNNSSGYMGVSFHKNSGLWKSYINNSEGKTVSLGYFKTIKEAADAYEKGKIEHGYHKNHGRVV